MLPSPQMSILHLFLIILGVLCTPFWLAPLPHPSGGIFPCQGLHTLLSGLVNFLELEQAVSGSLPCHPVLEKGVTSSR